MERITVVALILIASGCMVLSQRREPVTTPQRNRPRILVPQECPHICNCTSADNKQTSPFKMAVCSELPTSLQSHIKFLQVTGDLNHVTVQQISQLDGHLFKLDLSGCNINSIEPGAFDSLIHLVYLKLSNNNIKKLQRDIFFTSNLIELHMDGNSMEEIEEGAFDNLQKLNKLYLQDNSLVDVYTKLPSTLLHLDLSHNKLSQLTTELNQKRLKYLDLCGNPMTVFPSLTSSIALETICLEGQAAKLPEGIATNFPRLVNITLVAQYKTYLDTTTEQELSKLNKLMQLCLENYDLLSLTFLSNKENLNTLKLINVNLQSISHIESLKNLKFLTYLVIDRSPQLVKPVLQNPTILTEMSKLRTLSMKYAEIVSIGDIFPKYNFRLDISHNPLRCDCKFAWIQFRERDSLGQFLLSKEDTICKTPEHIEGDVLLAHVNIQTCSHEDTNEKIEQIEDITTTTTTIATTTTEEEDHTIQDYFHMHSSPVPPSETPEKTDNTTMYIIIGIVLLILLIIGIILATTLYLMKKRRKCHITPEGETAMEQQPQQQLKQASSKDMLVKK